MSQDLSPDSLVASPESRLDDVSATGEDGCTNKEFTIHRQEGNVQINAQHLRANRAKVNDRNGLHPYVQTLVLKDVDSCVALENAVFPEEERCSREKVHNLTRFSSTYFYPEASIYACFFKALTLQELSPIPI